MLKHKRFCQFAQKNTEYLVGVHQAKDFMKNRNMIGVNETVVKAHLSNIIIFCSYDYMHKSQTLTDNDIEKMIYNILKSLNINV